MRLTHSEPMICLYTETVQINNYLKQRLMHLSLNNTETTPT